MEIRVQVSGIYSYNYESLSFCKEKGLTELHLETKTLDFKLLWENCFTEFI